MCASGLLLGSPCQRIVWTDSSTSFIPRLTQGGPGRGRTPGPDGTVNRAVIQGAQRKRTAASGAGIGPAVKLARPR